LVPEEVPAGPAYSVEDDIALFGAEPCDLLDFFVNRGDFGKVQVIHCVAFPADQMSMFFPFRVIPGFYLSGRFELPDLIRINKNVQVPVNGSEAD